MEPGSIPGLPGNVVPLGRISRDEVVQKLSQTWCLVHPSKADTGPTAAKEARVMGVPVIISDQCGSQQYIEQGKSGYIIAPTDVNSLVQGVLEITSSKERSISMGQYGQSKCRESLSAATMINRLLEIYGNLLG